MPTVREWLRRLWGTVRRDPRDRDLEDELKLHLDLAAEELRRRGGTSTAARRAARLEAGGVEQALDALRDQRGLPWLDDLARDVRYACRSLRRTPAFTAVALLTLTIGIGANTAIFSIVDGALLHPVPFADPDRLVVLHQTTTLSKTDAISYLNFLDWKRQNHTFEEIAAWRTDTFTLTGRGQALHLVGLMVSANFFSTLRVQPLAGRTFHADEDQQGAAPVAMIGEDLWVRQFGRDPRIVGQALALSGRTYTVIGVVPASVRLDRTGPSSFANDVFVPIGQYDALIFRMRGSGDGTIGLGRLNPGVDVTQAQADMNTVAASLERAYPGSNRGVGVDVATLQDTVVFDVRRTLWMLLGAVSFVLLIACANVANLALARSLGRSQEFAVRSALGAGHGRLMRQLLTESVILAGAGGVLGGGLALLITGAAIELLPVALPVTSQVHVNMRVLTFAATVSVATGLLFGLAPARHASRPDIDKDLRARGRGLTEQTRLQSVLVVGQVALTLVLLVGAGLTIRSLVRLLTGSFGFDPQNLVIVQTEVPADRRANPDAVRAALSDLNDRLGEIPGVEAASVHEGTVPFSNADTALGFWRADGPPPKTPANLREATYSAVGPDYFRTMRIRLLRGRVFARQDDASHPLVAIVDRDLALTTFDSLDVVGQRISNGFEQTLEIVGIVDHVAYRGLDADNATRVRAELYVPYAQLPDSITAVFASNVFAILRSPVAPAALFGSVRDAIVSFDPNVSMHDERSMRDAITASQDRRRFSLIVLGMFAIAALILSAVGIYGLVSYGVSRRTRDIGVRLALGASTRDVLRGVLGEAGRLAVAGTLLGVVVALGLTRLIATLLFGVSPIDPITFGGTAALLLVVTLMASYIPARRATKVDPMVALRCD